MKFENISKFSLIILVGISEYWDAQLCCVASYVFYVLFSFGIKSIKRN